MMARGEVTYLKTDDFTEEICAEILANLSATRKEKAERYRSAQDKYVSAGAGYLLDCALKKIGLRERDASFVYGKNGKPYLKEGGLYFNLSHSGTLVVCATARQEVGVDVQKIVPVSEGLMKRVCSEEERALLNALPMRARDEEFCRLWTVKESVAKCTGEGLPLLLRGMEAERSLCVQEFALDGYRLAVCTAAEEEFTLTQLPVLRSL